MWNLLCLIAVSLAVTSNQHTSVFANSYNSGGNLGTIRQSALTYRYAKKWQDIAENNTEKSTVEQPTTTSTGQNDTCPPCTCGALGKKLGIVGGNSTFVNEYPWMAMLLYKKKFFCGGSLINDRYVMTATHCVRRKIVEKITVRLLEYNQNTTTETDSMEYKVLKVIMHEEFDSFNFDNDIALLRLDTNLIFDPESKIHPVCLPERGNSYEDYQGIVIGWGRTGEVKPESNVLLQVALPILNNDVCEYLGGYFYFTRLTDNMICAGYDAGGKDTCQGDSGGPLHIIENEYYHVAGIVSWGKGCARPDNLGVYTRVNKYLDWLADKTKDACSCKNVNNMTEAYA